MLLPLDPRSDIVFRILFGHPARRDLLVALLQAVLGAKPVITGVELLDPEMPKEHIAERGLALDLRVRLSDGRLIDVEMQVAAHGGLRERILAYWAKLFLSQISPGDDYVKLHPCLSVVFLGERYLPGPRACSKFQIREVTDGSQWTDAFELYLIELPKVAPPADDALTRWARFFQTNDDEERETLSQMDPNIGKALHAIQEMANDPEIRELVRLRELANMNWQHSHACALEEGWKKGRDEGYSEGRDEGYSEGHDEGYSEGRDEGRDEGARARSLKSIEELAVAFGLEWDAGRQATLAEMTNAELEALFSEVLRLRAWPERR